MVPAEHFAERLRAEIFFFFNAKVSSSHKRFLPPSLNVGVLIDGQPERIKNLGGDLDLVRTPNAEIVSEYKVEFIDLLLSCLADFCICQLAAFGHT
jgi:hypothetical protein